MPSSLPHRRRAWWWGVTIPALIYAAGAVVLAWGWPRLPAHVVVHFGVDGVRLGAPAEIPAVLALLVPQFDGREFTPDGPLALAAVASLIAGGIAAARAGRDPLVPATEPVPREAPRLAGRGHGTEHLADRGAVGPVARWHPQVHPLGDFGGWGLRIAADTRGTIGVI